MSLSSSTIILFAFLIPAIIFRYTVYANSIVKRQLGAGNIIHITVSVLTLSVIIQIVSFFLFWALSAFSAKLFGYEATLAITEFDQEIFIFYNNLKFTITKFIFEHYFVALVYFSVLLLTSIILAVLFVKAARRMEAMGRLIYGPLAPMLSGQMNTILPCYVLSKIASEHRRIVYTGFVAEVALKDGSNIDHIVLDSAEKFYFKMNQRSVVTTGHKPQQLSGSYYGSGLLYISGDDIENVYFDEFSLTGIDATLLSNLEHFE